MLKHVLAPINRAGWPFIALFALASLGLGFLWPPLLMGGLVATLWCAYFFRDPARTTPSKPGLVMAPADGLILSICTATPPPELGFADTPMHKISIFLSIFDVHINRVPMAGHAAAVHYHPGKFLNASLDKASELNERSSTRFIAATTGEAYGVVQIAGLVARRIINTLKVGQTVTAGERMGLIRFGSRTDLYIPAHWSVHVIAGQRTLGGETVLADALAQADNLPMGHRR